MICSGGRIDFDHIGESTGIASDRIVLKDQCVLVGRVRIGTNYIICKTVICDGTTGDGGIAAKTHRCIREGVFIDHAVIQGKRTAAIAINKSACIVLSHDQIPVCGFVAFLMLDDVQLICTLVAGECGAGYR